MENFKKYSLGFCTFLCILLLICDIVIFSLKDISQKYINEKKINNVMKNIKITDILNSDEDEQLNDIKNKIIESGINKEKINDFIKTDIINDYAGEKASTAIQNSINNKNEELLKNGEIYSFFDKNISRISEELEEKGISNTGIETREKQEEFLNKIEEKSPIIEERINSIANKLYEKINNSNYVLRLEKIIKILNILYSKVLTLILIFIFIIFSVGIIITRQSFYKSLKWIGISFLSSSCIMYLICNIMNRIINRFSVLPSVIRDFIKYILNDSTIYLKKYALVFLIISIILIMLNVVIYFILDKYENKKYEILR